MLFNSEMIVVLWLIPVAICLLIPLSMLFFWSIMQLLKKINGKSKQAQKSMKEAIDQSDHGGFQSKSVA